MFEWAGWSGSVFGFRAAGGEVLQGGLRVLLFVEHGVDLVDDGGVHAEASGQGERGPGGGIAFGNTLAIGKDRLGFFAAADPLAEAAVAAECGKASHGEVAEAAEAGEGFGLSAAGDAEAAHFGDAAGDESGFGIVAEAESIRDAGGDGHDIFEGTAEFDAEDVVAGVDAE